MRLVTGLFTTTKRLLVGRPMQSEHLGHTLLPKKIALPVFASDALSSVAYATEEILIVLSVGGLALLHYTPYIGAAVGRLRLRGREHQSRPARRPGRRQRPNGRLHADRRGVGIGRGSQSGIGFPGA